MPACLIAALSHICSRTFLDLTVMAWVIRTTCSLSDMLRSLWLDLHSALPLGVSCSPLFPPQVPSQGISCLFFGTCLTGHSLSRKFSVTPPSPLRLSHSPPQLGIGVSLLHSTHPKPPAPQHTTTHLYGPLVNSLFTLPVCRQLAVLISSPVLHPL